MRNELIQVNYVKINRVTKKNRKTVLRQLFYYNFTQKLALKENSYLKQVFLVKLLRATGECLGINRR